MYNNNSNIRIIIIYVCVLLTKTIWSCLFHFKRAIKKPYQKQVLENLSYQNTHYICCYFLYEILEYIVANKTKCWPAPVLDSCCFYTVNIYFFNCLSMLKLKFLNLESHTHARTHTHLSRLVRLALCVKPSVNLWGASVSLVRLQWELLSVQSPHSEHHPPVRRLSAPEDTRWHWEQA